MSDKQKLVDGLNKDLEGEYQAVIMYTTYAATVLGPHRKALSDFFSAEVQDELEHASLLANKIAVLGGTPVTANAPVPDNSDPWKMLEAVRDAEAETIERYVQRREDAEKAGESGLAIMLEDLIADETRHRDECEKLLRGNWSN